MNDKLAQAVKLYDHILTQQVSRPIWRQQAVSHQAQPFSQWNYAQSSTSPQPTHTLVTEPGHQPSSTYASPQAYPPASAGTSYPPLSQSPPQTQTQSSYISSVASPPIATASLSNTHYHQVPTLPSAASQQYQYAHPVQPVSIQQPPPPIHAPAQVITSPQQSVPVVAQSTPVNLHMSSPPTAHYRQQSLPQSLSRHNTIPHAAHVPSAPVQQQYPPVPASTLPNFPSVPTVPPSLPYGSYDSPSSAVEQPKKEALLIEL